MNEQIKTLQNWLSTQHLIGTKFITGNPNDETTAAIKKIQKLLKLPETGNYDDNTSKLINQALKKDPEFFTKNLVLKQQSNTQLPANLKNTETVKSIQNYLINKRILSPKDLTGIYDRKTYEAVKILQNIIKVAPTGYWDDNTKKELELNSKTIDKSITNQYSNWNSSLQKLDVKALPKDNVILIFDGKFLCWTSNGDVIKKWNAVSGSKVNFDEKTNSYSSKLEDFENKIKGKLGPIPVGKYTLGALQQMKFARSQYSLFDLLKYQNKGLFYNEQESHQVIDFKTAQKNQLTRIAWGQFRIPIIGSRYGRDRFYVHGGALAGSSGCIDLGDDGMENFTQTLTKTFGQKKQNMLLKFPLLVFYGINAEELIKNSSLLNKVYNATTDELSDELIKLGVQYSANNRKNIKPAIKKQIKAPEPVKNEKSFAQDIGDEWKYAGRKASQGFDRLKKMAGL